MELTEAWTCVVGETQSSMTRDKLSDSPCRQYVGLSGWAYTPSPRWLGIVSKRYGHCRQTMNEGPAHPGDVQSAVPTRIITCVQYFRSNGAAEQTLDGLSTEEAIVCEWCQGT
jgi:hypothetical protein